MVYIAKKNLHQAVEFNKLDYNTVNMFCAIFPFRKYVIFIYLALCMVLCLECIEEIHLR